MGGHMARWYSHIGAVHFWRENSPCRNFGGEMARRQLCIGGGGLDVHWLNGKVYMSFLGYRGLKLRGALQVAP